MLNSERSLAPWTEQGRFLAWHLEQHPHTAIVCLHRPVFTCGHRANPELAVEYEAVKRRLASRFRDDRHGYTDAKGPILWEIIRKADEWAQAQGWLPGPSDA